MKKKSQTHQSFFSKMMLICSISFILFSLCASSLIAYLSGSYERSQYLKNYDLALNSLSQSFQGHCSSLYTLVSQIVAEGHCDSDLCNLLSEPDYQDVSASTRSLVIRLLNNMRRSSDHLSGFLLYSIGQEQLYYYASSSSMLFPSAPGVSVDYAPFQFQKCPSDDISGMIAACMGEEVPGDSHYGFVTTIYRTPAEPLGYLIPVYTTQEFDTILDNYQLSYDVMFTISDSRGNLFYNSNPALDLPKKHTTAAFTNTDYDFNVRYAVDFRQSLLTPVTALSMVLAAMLSLFSFGIYFLTYRLSNRKINRILDGLEIIGIDHLSYRIPEPDARDEFTRIISGLNHMCDSLEENIQRSYIYELQQKKSELYALQASINPHFLYNTLEIIRQQMQSGHVSGAGQMILLLSRIYRGQNSRRFFNTIEDETELCENLMCLYQYRFQNFDYLIETDEKAARFALPQNTMQPIIENYFVHGIDPSREDNLLEIITTLEQGPGDAVIHLVVRNNGRNMTREQIEHVNGLLEQDIYANKGNHGFALTNINSRMKILFADSYRMSITTPEEGPLLMNTGEASVTGFSLELTFPARTVSELEGLLPDS